MGISNRWLEKGTQECVVQICFRQLFSHEMALKR